MNLVVAPTLGVDSLVSDFDVTTTVTTGGEFVGDETVVVELGVEVDEREEQDEDEPEDEGGEHKDGKFNDVDDELTLVRPESIVIGTVLVVDVRAKVAKDPSFTIGVSSRFVDEEEITPSSFPLSTQILSTCSISWVPTYKLQLNSLKHSISSLLNSTRLTPPIFETRV